MNRDSKVTDYGMDGRGSILGKGTHFAFRHYVKTDSEAHPASCPMGAETSFPGMKRSKCGAGQGECMELYSPLCLATRTTSPFLFKNAGSCTFTPPIRLHGVVLS
jgi:hypothetical protein